MEINQLTRGSKVKIVEQNESDRRIAEAPKVPGKIAATTQAVSDDEGDLECGEDEDDEEEEDTLNLNREELAIDVGEDDEEEEEGDEEEDLELEEETTPSLRNTPTGDASDQLGGSPDSMRQRIPIKYIENKTRRHVTFAKRRHGIMKKAYELSVLTGANVLLLILSGSGLVYTFSTPKLEPVIRDEEGKGLIRACLNGPDGDSAAIFYPPNELE
ncbi:hypothetical protein NCAS_0A12960 [Naumovozyma castellii]|uniref:MADS-box domain-containing protein n=1 Tax=Naumovozyma castellii TaxID=27288 RepID=G0V8Q5_NAUCA|nr:hypothetical protein NCAS_0A12960 [Naumovozyma castellii CBS 4309]CCC67854.1 hypothetical protein NCAS_0A12960 [Naumovozyma castellii CBS 4309]